jgi:hypothetical protein
MCLLVPPVQLREQRAAVEELVDCVVEGYHAGFNKSIHNYSQILRLFSESKLQVGCCGGAGVRRECRMEEERSVECLGPVQGGWEG